MKILKRWWNSVGRLMTAGRKVFPYLLAVLVGIVVAWIVVQGRAPGAASRYTTAVFLGGLLATAMVIAFLAASRDLSDLASLERRAEHQHAVIALVFDARGRLIMHFQSPHRATSWPEHWVPPGGLVENGGLEGAAQERLKLLVDDTHGWGDAAHLASTNNSRAYRRMNRREGQVPVQVEAYWVQWSEEDPWVPEDAYDSFDHRILRLADRDSMPDPVPPYYPELFEYLDAVRMGKGEPADLACWTLPETSSLEAILQTGQRLGL